MPAVLCRHLPFISIFKYRHNRASRQYLVYLMQTSNVSEAANDRFLILDMAMLYVVRKGTSRPTAKSPRRAIFPGISSGDMGVAGYAAVRFDHGRTPPSTRCGARRSQRTMLPGRTKTTPGRQRRHPAEAATCPLFRPAAGARCRPAGRWRTACECSRPRRAFRHRPCAGRLRWP